MKTWNKMNKTKAILLHLQENGSITSWEAIKEYGATRLSAIIYNLRHNYGLNIISKKVEFTDRYGTPSDYAEYLLVFKLYQLTSRKNVKLYFDDQTVIFDHIDGAYSYCWLEENREKLVHISVNASFIKYKDGYKYCDDNILKGGDK